jgi:glucose-1-phosphate adenylyltransferase
MEMLGQCPSFDLYKKTYKIISNSDADARPPQYIGPKAHVKNSIISNGCKILGHVENSIISPGVAVEEGAHVENSILFPDVSIGKNALVRKAILGENVHVGEGAVIGIKNESLESGDSPEDRYEPNGITIIENGTRVKPGILILAGSEITLQEGEQK